MCFHKEVRNNHSLFIYLFYFFCILSELRMFELLVAVVWVFSRPVDVRVVFPNWTLHHLNRLLSLPQRLLLRQSPDTWSHTCLNNSLKATKQSLVHSSSHIRTVLLCVSITKQKCEWYQKNRSTPLHCFPSVELPSTLIQKHCFHRSSFGKVTFGIVHYSLQMYLNMTSMMILVFGKH